MRRPQFRLRSLFILTAIVAVGCLGIVNAKNAGLNPIEGAVIGVLVALLIASQWPKVWPDRRIYDRWPKTGVFPKPEDEQPGDASMPPNQATPPSRPPTD